MGGRHFSVNFYILFDFWTRLHITFKKNRTEPGTLCKSHKTWVRAADFHPWALNYAVVVEMGRDRFEKCVLGVKPPRLGVGVKSRAEAEWKMLPRLRYLVEDGMILSWLYRREACWGKQRGLENRFNPWTQSLQFSSHSAPGTLPCPTCPCTRRRRIWLQTSSLLVMFPPARHTVSAAAWVWQSQERVGTTGGSGHWSEYRVSQGAEANVWSTRGGEEA